MNFSGMPICCVHQSLLLNNHSSMPSLTSKIDYINKYPSVLQRSSYNFIKTEKIGHLYADAVKARNFDH